VEAHIIPSLQHGVCFVVVPAVFQSNVYLPNTLFTTSNRPTSLNVKFVNCIYKSIVAKLIGLQI
jgi:hypothetical protein